MTAPNQTRIYHVTLTDGTTFHLAANFAEPAAPLMVQWPGGAAWQTTPWTTADVDARQPWQAAALVVALRGDTGQAVATVELLEDDHKDTP